MFDKKESLASTTTCWCGGRAVLSSDQTTRLCADSEYHDPDATGAPGEIRKLYIAGPMTGYEDCNYPEFNRVAALLTEAGYEVANPATSELKAAHYVDFLREDLRWMLDCDAVAVLDNWWESTGARNEVQVAGVLKMPVRTYEEWLDMPRPPRSGDDES